MANQFVDPVVAEVHATRAFMLETAGGDIETLMQQVALRQQKSGRKIVHNPPLRDHASADQIVLPPVKH